MNWDFVKKMMASWMTSIPGAVMFCIGASNMVTQYAHDHHVTAESLGLLLSGIVGLAAKDLNKH